MQIFENRTARKHTEHQNELKALKLTNAIKMAISSTAQDSDLVAGLVDRNKLILGEDGKVTGLEEQVKALKESKPFLFKQEQQTGKGRKDSSPLGAPKAEPGGEEAMCQ
ncbi:MAG: phage scaffolding protein [Ruminococcus sp.]